MPRIVMKFGGTSMAGIERIRAVAERVRREAEAGNQVAVVVSAMAGETDRLVQMCREAAPLYDPREYDVVVASGEQVTSGLLAITLQGMGLNAKSYMGWQLPIRASGHSAALIENIDVDVLERVFDGGGIAVIPGFQGVTADNAVATLSLAPSIPENFTFTPDGKALLGNSYYTGVSNVFRFDIANGKHEVLTNASTGFFWPQQRPDGSLLVYDYAGDGLNPSIVQPQVREDLASIRFLGTELVKARPELKQWGVGSPAKVPLDELVTARGSYDPLRRMRFDAHYPIVSGYDRSPAFGYYLHLADPLQFRQLSATVAVSPFGKVRGKERLHLNVEYQTPNWKLTYWHNLADFYDLAGPVLRSRKGDAFIASYSRPLIYDPPRQLDVFGSASVFFGLRQLPGAQNIASPKEIRSAEIGMRFTDKTSALGGVDHEKGIAARIVAGTDQAQGQFYPKLYGGADVGTALPWGNSSAWLYGHAGIAGGDRESPLSAFYFGSFRNNYVDDRPVKRYREAESFPGFAIDEIAARRYAKLTGEVNLPPLRFAEVGTPAFYLSHLRPAVFGSVLATQAPDGSSHRYMDVGAQLDLNFTVALRLPMVLSVGAGSGWADGDYRKTELLVSLKIM